MYIFRFFLKVKKLLFSKNIFYMIKPKNLKMYRRSYYPDTHKSWLFQQEQPEFNLSASKIDITFAKYNFVNEDVNMVPCDTSEIQGRKAMKHHLENELREEIQIQKIEEFQKLTKSRVKIKKIKKKKKKSILKKSKSARNRIKMKPPIPGGKNRLVGYSKREQEVRDMIEERERKERLRAAMKKPEQLINLKNVPTVKVNPLKLELMTKEEENKIIKMKVNKNRREEIQIFYEISNIQGRSLPTEKTEYIEDTPEGSKTERMYKKLRFNV